MPTGWTIFGSEAGQTNLQLSLESGEVALLGLYILPDNLPAVGTDFPFTVDVEMAGAPLVNDSAASSFTMPATPFPYMQVEPLELFTEAGSTAEFTATMTNIGNASATFDWSSAVPINGWDVSAPTSPVLLAPGESVSQQLQVTVTSGIPGLDYPVTISGVAPTLPYTPTTAIRGFCCQCDCRPDCQCWCRVGAMFGRTEPRRASTTRSP